MIYKPLTYFWFLVLPIQVRIVRGNIKIFYKFTSNIKLRLKKNLIIWLNIFRKQIFKNQQL